MPRPFNYSSDAIQVRSTGTPLTASALPIFELLVNQTRSMIADGAGQQPALKTLIHDKAMMLSTERFEGVGAVIPEAQRLEIEKDSIALADAIAQSLSWTIVATIVNFIGTTSEGLPIFSFANTVADPEVQTQLPLTAGQNKVPVPV